MLFEENFIKVTSPDVLNQYPDFLSDIAKVSTAEQYADALADYQRKRLDEMQGVMNALSLISPGMVASDVERILQDSNLDKYAVVEINGGFTLVSEVAHAIAEEATIPWWKNTTEDITNWTKANAESIDVTVDELLESVCDKQLYLQEAYSYLKSLGNAEVALRLTDFSNTLATFGRSASSTISKTMSWFTSMLSKVDGLKNGLASLLEGIRSSFNSLEPTNFEEYTGVNPTGAYIKTIQNPGYWAAVLLTPYGIWEATKFLYKAYDNLMENVIKPWFRQTFKKVSQTVVNPYDLLMGEGSDATTPSINRFSTPVFPADSTIQPEPWITFDNKSEANAFLQYVIDQWKGTAISSLYTKEYNLVWRTIFGEISFKGQCYVTTNVVTRVGLNGISYYAVPSRIVFTGSDSSIRVKPYLLDYDYLWASIAKRFNITVDVQTTDECKNHTRFNSCDGIKFSVGDDKATIRDFFDFIQDFTSNPSFIDTSIHSEQAAYGSILCSNTILALLGPLFFSNQSTYVAVQGTLKPAIESLFPWGQDNSAPDLSNVNQQYIALKKFFEAIFAGSCFASGSSLPISWYYAQTFGQVTNAHFLYAASSKQTTFDTLQGLALNSFCYRHSRDNLSPHDGFPALLDTREVLWYLPYMFIIGDYYQDALSGAVTISGTTVSSPAYFTPYYSGQSEFRANSLYTIKTDGQNAAAVGALVAVAVATVASVAVGVTLSKAKKSLRYAQANRDALYRELGNKISNGTATDDDFKAYNAARRNVALAEKFMNAGAGLNATTLKPGSISNPSDESTSTGTSDINDIRRILSLISGNL